MRIGLSAVRLKTRMMSVTMDEDVKTLTVQQSKQLLRICHQAKLGCPRDGVCKVERVVMDEKKPEATVRCADSFELGS